VVPFGIAAILLSLFTILHPGVRIERRRLARDEARAARVRAGLDGGAATGPLGHAAPGAGSAEPSAEAPAEAPVTGDADPLV
jgi:hypothetical protein